MERKIGETFEYESKTLKVKEDKNGSCHDCFFNKKCTLPVIKMAGECAANCREDNKGVVFVEVHEQPQELNLCEILKDCPKGERFWSPLLGDVKLSEVNQLANAVFVTATNLTTWRINHDATITINGGSSPEIMLYPSREQRDWVKVKYEPKKEKFDPKTLKAFDKVLTRDEHFEDWSCDIFSYISDDEPFKYITISNSWKCCIPYNDDTKHLVGTKDEAPEFYRYWED